jgi:ABC-type glycerol-3-phosphate transport system substrate-binding protein
MLRRLALLLIIFGLGMAACGRDDDDGDSDANDESPAISATLTLSFSVNLVMWHPFNDQRAEALATATEGFNTDNAGSILISLEYHTPESIKSDYEEALRSGEGPDILVAKNQWLAELYDQRLIYPIDETVVNIIQSNIPVTVFHSFYYQDQVLAAPLWADVLILYTNSSLVDEAPTTIDDLISASDEQPFVLYPGIVGTAGLYDDSTDSFLVSLDGDLILFRQNFADYLQVYRRLLGTGGITFSDDPAEFIDGEVGGIVAFASDYQQFHDALGDDLQVSLLPVNNQANWQMFSCLTPLVISQNSPDSNIAAANLFFAYLLNPNIQVQVAAAANRIPFATPSDEDLNEVARIGLRQLQWAHSQSPYPLFYDVVLPELNAILDDVSPSSTNSDLNMLVDQFFINIQK